MKLKLKKFKIVKSTNDIAINLIKKNICKPTIITTIQQTKGRGTMGKKWISKSGNLFISIFFSINKTKLNFKQLAILNAYLVKKVIKKYSTYKINIKWPNDLLIKREKVCGILQEIINHKSKDFLIIGIGINTNLAPKIKNLKVTSLNIGRKKKFISNNRVLKDLKKVYEKFIDDIEIKTFLDLKKKLA